MTMMQTGIRERFDYGRMAREAESERDRLRAIIKRRRDRGPADRESPLEWDQGNRRFYTMYLEQRRNAMEFQRRARERGANGT